MQTYSAWAGTCALPRAGVFVLCFHGCVLGALEQHPALKEVAQSALFWGVLLEVSHLDFILILSVTCC